MATAFWTAVIAMTITALLFVLQPALGIRHRRIFVALAVAIPAVAIGTYLSLGNPQMASSSSIAPHPTASRRPTASTNGPVAPVSSLVDGLAARLAGNPDDGDGWVLLARSYQHLGRLDEARQAYARAQALGKYDPGLVELADLEAGERRDTKSVSAVTGRVSLSDETRQLVRPTDAVYIFARAAGRAGAPAAVVQTTAASWPIEFRLTDANSMVAGILLSDLEEVIVTARVTRTGDATSALQGLESKSSPVKVAGDEPVDLFIETAHEKSMKYANE